MKNMVIRGCLLGLTLGWLAETAGAAPAEIVPTGDAGWAQFRGPWRDGISRETGLLQSWPEGGPRVLWTATGAGKGFSSPVVTGGRVLVTGDFGEDVVIVAYDPAGKELWRAKNGAAWLNQYQGARASVTVSEGRVYHQNAHGRVVCLDARDGKELWAVNVLERYRGENNIWGLSECLLVDERVVYVTAGGREALMVALDKRTGAEVWRSAPLTDAAGEGELEKAAYTPPVLLRFAGRRLVVGHSARYLFCLDADTGVRQWEQRRPTPYFVQAVTPTLIGDAIFMAAPLGAPGRLYRLRAPAAPDGKVGVEQVWESKLDTCHGGVVHVGGRIYGSYYPKRGGWAALDAATGAVLYEDMEHAKGSVLWADGRLHVQTEDGWMLLLEPTAERFEVRGKFRLGVAKDRNAWAHPVILDGRMYLRFGDTVTCYDVKR